MSTIDDKNPGQPRGGLTRRTVLGTGAVAAALTPALMRRATASPQRSAAQRRGGSGELPWREIERRELPPGEPGRDYTPVFTPNGITLEAKVVGGVKVFHLVAEPIVHEIAEGLTIQAWGYNGRTPGPTLEVVEGDRVRVYVTNRLPASTSVHWHGLILPNGMDGVPGITQPAIQPGETYVYEFTFAFPGTFMYHPHVDAMTEEGMGMSGMIVVHPRAPRERRPDRDFCIMLMEWKVPGATRRPNPNEMSDFNVLTMNGRAFPDTHPLVAQLGDRVRIRLGNLSQMSHHPIHLHGYAFHVTETDGGYVPPEARWPETTVLVQVGSVRAVEFDADNPGDWLMHCHMTHHMMNQMGHDIPNMIGVDARRAEPKIRSLLPGYMTMGQNGMEDMGAMADHMAMPPNAIPMRGLNGPFGQTVMGGMATVLKVRENAIGYDDPGWYQFAPGEVSYRASAEQLSADGIDEEGAR